MVSNSFIYKPAERWNLDNRFTTRFDVCVRTPTDPPYGVIGNKCVVPRKVETATHLKKKFKHILVYFRLESCLFTSGQNEVFTFFREIDLTKLLVKMISRKKCTSVLPVVGELFVYFRSNIFFVKSISRKMIMYFRNPYFHKKYFI